MTVCVPLILYRAVVLHDYDAITRRVVFRNVDARIRSGERCNPSLNSKVVQKACSMTIDFESPSLPFHLLQLSGRYAIALPFTLCCLSL